MRRAAPVLMLVAALQTQAAWLELRHGPFVVYTDAGAEPARLALNHLEQFRYAVGEAAGKSEPTLSWTVTVVVRKPAKGVPEPFVGFSRDGWILAWPAGSQPSPGVFRDFARIILDNNVPRPMPPGFEAALASLYSTLQVQGQRLTLGAPPPESERTLEWAILHRLSTTEESRARAHVFFSNLANGAEEEIAWRNAYGPPPAGTSLAPKMRQAAADYLKAGQFTTRQMMGRLVPEREFHEIPALPSRIRLLPGDLALGRGAPPAEVRAAYEAALNEKPSPAGHEGRALALLAEKRTDDAHQELIAATAADGAGPRAYYELARLEKDPARKLQLLETAVKLNIQWADPFLELAALEPGPIRRAAHLQKAVSLRPRDPQLWLSLAQAQFDEQKFADAEKSMRMALGAAPDDAARAELTRRFEDFEQAKSDAETAKRKKERDEEAADLERVRTDALNRIRKSEQAANEQAGSVKGQKVENWWDGPPTKSLSVTLKQVDCLGKRARLVLDNAGQPLRLLIPNSGQIVVLGPDGTPSDQARMGCGAQRPPRHVKIEYTPRPDAAAGTAGDAVSLQFLAETKP